LVGNTYRDAGVCSCGKRTVRPNSRALARLDVSRVSRSARRDAQKDALSARKLAPHGLRFAIGVIEGRLPTMNSSTIRPLLVTGTLFIVVAACSGVVEAPDEGAGDSTGVATCSSEVYWKDKELGSEAMSPGGKCNECHDKKPTSPNYVIAGTVYPTFKEPDDCNGVNGGLPNMPDVTVVVTEKGGRTLPAVPVNSVGNFKLESAVPPFWVKVVSKGKENKMMMQAPHGDCNACHTQTGANGAPGRIVIPQ
jgi:hypothetical protein